jgi:hypothetical protein
LVYVVYLKIEVRKKQEDTVKNRLNYQILAAGIVIIAGFLISGCNMALNNALQDPYELFAKKGAVIITNVSNSETVKSIKVERLGSADVEKVIAPDTSEGGNDLIKARESLQVVLDPGTYKFTVDYGEKAVSPPPKEWTIMEYKYHSWYVTGEVTSDPVVPSTKGILQIINFSGGVIESVKIEGDSKALPADGIQNKGTISFSLDAGKYKVEVSLPDLAKNNSEFPDPVVAEDVEIKIEEATNLIVFPDGHTEVGIIGSDGINNLWILNRADSDITDVQRKLSSGGSYTALFPENKPIKAAVGYAGARLLPGEYDIRVNLGEKGLEKPRIIVNNDPVFLIVTNDKIEVIRGGDSDGDGFPDWWEDQYFGPDAKDNPDLPPKDGDADLDGVNNWDEYLDGTDPIKQDTDGDGLWDGEEKTGKRNPGIQPEDRPSGIQIPDTFTPTDPLLVDTDGDGYSDYLELIYKTDPNNKASVPRIEIHVPWGA